MLSVSTYVVVAPKTGNGVATPPDGVENDPGQRLFMAEERFTEWPLIRYVHPRDQPVDWLFAADALRVVSGRLRDIFDRYLGPDDEIQWLAAEVVTAAGRTLPYWVPHFPRNVDLLDLEKTDIGPSGQPIRMVLSSRKLKRHAVTIVPQSSLSVIISHEVLTAMRQQGVTGYEVRSIQID